MPAGSPISRVVDSLAYRIQWLGLTLFGPAQQDSEHDPIEILKRKYGRDRPRRS